MKITLLNISGSKIVPILAQSTDLSSGMSSALNIVMLIGFLFGVVCVISGGFAIRRGDADAGKMSIIGGLIIAGAPIIVKALFTAFGNQGATVDMGGASHLRKTNFGFNRAGRLLCPSSSRKTILSLRHPNH
ncbi:MAG TPA: hypothetical protein VIK59_11825 [Verrucomicrobiae bacterium]